MTSSSFAFNFDTYLLAVLSVFKMTFKNSGVIIENISMAMFASGLMYQTVYRCFSRIFKILSAV